MKAIRVLFAAILLATAVLLPSAWGTSFTTDQSDLWYVQNESGWGMQLVQRDSVIFATIFVYDSTNIPIWYTATLSYAGDFVWTGDLYLTSGPWFGTVPFNPNTVGYRKVGTMTWTADTTTTGTLAYVVDGVTVTKNVTRQFLVYDDFSGHYGGSIHQTASGCANSAFNGALEITGILNITQNGQSIAIGALPSTGGSCSYTGVLSQAGQMGSVTGSFACSSGETGSFQIYEMQVNPIGVTGRFAAASNTYAGCQYNGWFGGIVVTTF